MKQKKIYLEAIRIFAISFVIYVHTGTDASEYYMRAGNSFSYLLSLILYVIGQASIPLFFLVSGAVLLHKEESLTWVLKHRALRIFILILLFGFLQYAYCYYLRPEVGFSIPIFAWTIYSTTIITQYWYLYAYFALMLILPFIRMMARNMKNSHFWYLFGLFFLLEGLLPILEFIWKNERVELSVPLLANSILYPLLGYYIVHRSDKFFYSRKVLLLANLMGFAALFTNTVVALMAHRQRGMAESLNGMTAVLALVIFIDIRAFCNYAANSPRSIWHGSFAKVAKQLCLFISGGVFGVYLLEPQLRDTFHFIYTALQPHISWFPATILWITAAILCGATLFRLLQKVPLLRKLL